MGAAVRAAGVWVTAMTVLFASCLLAGCDSGQEKRGEMTGTSDVEALVDCVDDARAGEAVAPVSAPEGLRDALEQATKAHAGTYAVACASADGSWSVDVNGDEPFVSASIIKLAILGTLLDQAQSGALSLDDSVTVDPSDVVGGTGVIQASGAGGSYTYRQLAAYMIQDSDNIATNLIIDAVGMPAANEYASEIGLTQTVLNRRMMDFSTDVENYTSANDVARMLQLIYQGKLVSPDASEFALDLLKGQHDGAGLLEGLPTGSVFAHKTGTLDGVFNDGGIVLASNPYVMVVLSSDAERSQAQDCMVDIAQAADAAIG